MSLTSRLKRLLQSRSTPQRSAAYDDLVERLFKAELATRALKVGDTAPAFLLPNAEGRLVSSEDLLAAGPAVMMFFRGGWCPYCELTMRVMTDAAPDIRTAGGTFVAVWPETGGLALRTKRQRALPYELLVDVDNAVAMQFGIVFRTPDLYRQLLLDQGIDLAERHGNPGWLLPAPATFIVSSDTVIRYAFVDGDYTNRAEPDAIVAVLRSLTKNR